MITPVWLSLQHWVDWLPSSAGMWLPAHLLYFVGGMALAVLQVVGARVRLAIAGPIAVGSYLLVSTSIAGDVNTGRPRCGRPWRRSPSTPPSRAQRSPCWFLVKATASSDC